MTGAGTEKAKLTLGPILFDWGPEEKRDFYFRLADEAPVDTVCVGEVVCAKRVPFFRPFLPEVVERLRRAGKEVLHSTLALITEEREIEAIRARAAEEDVFVEANDVSGIALLAGGPFAVGPFVNVYNEGTLRYLAGLGAVRVSLPVELSARSLAALAKARGEVELELQVFGRLPLAISARCYHARAHGLPKDACRYVCREDPDGMPVETLEGEPFLAVNGTQTLSYTYCNLIAELAALRRIGIDRFRLSPHGTDMVAVSRIFRDVLDGREDPETACHRLLPRLLPSARFSNGYYYAREGALLVRAEGSEAE